jgi:hypothetical protein
MGYTGQPVPTTETALPVGKTNDGKSVLVTFGNNATVVRGNFYFEDGFLGQAHESFVNGAAETRDAILTIEPAVYTTDQLTAQEAPARGDKLYFNATTGKFTLVATAVFAGIVTSGLGTGSTIDFLLAGQGVATVAETEQADGNIGDLSQLTTEAQVSLVAAINEVDANADAAQEDATEALGRVADNVTCAADADATAVRTAVIGVLTALKAAGLMTADA